VNSPTTTEPTHASGWVDDCGPILPEDIQALGNLWPGLNRYMTHRIPTGGFLRAVLENDLRGTVTRISPAIPNSTIFILVTLLNNYASAESWGSKEKVAAWLTKGGSDAVS